MSPRRIALFTGNYVNLVDGVALTLNRLVAYLESQGHEVVVFGPDGFPRALQPNGEFFGLPAISAPLQPEYRLALRMTNEAKARLERLAPDLIHIATPDLVGLWAQRYGLAKGIAVVASFHSNIVAYLHYVPVVRYLQPAGWTYFRYFYGRCRHIYVPTQSMADELREHGIREGLKIWARGIDLQRFSPSKRSADFRARHSIADDEVLILFVARLRWEKGLDLLAKAFQRLKSCGIKHRTMIVGEGVGYEPLRQRLPDTIFCGRLEGEELARAYASADLFFFPSAVETFGNVILEAMASGLASVCADAPGSKTVAIDRQSALLAQRDNVDDFVAKTLELLQNVDLRKQLAQAALVRAQEFSWDRANQQLTEHYEIAIAGDK
jgi:glycosyltransferase involved in cell wall biosynthesis